MYQQYKGKEAAGCPLIKGDHVIFGEAVYYFDGKRLEFVGTRPPGPWKRCEPL